MSSLSFDGSNKGRYVELTDDGTKARRQLGFCDGVVVSATHIKPGELVAVEILETQPGWSGDLRVGFTLLPDEALHPLPSFAIPELVTRGHSWIIPVGNAASLLASHRRLACWRRQQIQHRRSTRNTNPQESAASSRDWSPTNRSDGGPIRSTDETNLMRRVHLNPASPCACCLYTTFGRVAFRRLLPRDGLYLRPPDVEKGSIVAIYYELEACTAASPSRYSSPLSDYFHWPPNPVAVGEASEVEDAVDEASVQQPDSPGNTGDECRNSQQSTSRSRTSINQDPNLLDPLRFQFLLHIVINGIDLITISEQITLRQNQLSPSAWTGSTETETLPEQGVPHNETATCSPKMRAVLDVYGQTKAVQLISLHQVPVPRLSRLSSCAILRHILRICPPKMSTNGCIAGSSHLVNETSDHNSSPELLSRTSFKRAKSSLSGLSCTSPTAVGIDDAQPVWSNHSSFSRLMDNHRCKLLFAILTQLPLPPSVRRELQRDACAIVWRELVE